MAMQLRIWQRNRQSPRRRFGRLCVTDNREGLVNQPPRRRATVLRRAGAYTNGSPGSSGARRPAIHSSTLAPTSASSPS